MVDVTTPYATFDDVTKRYNPLLTMIGVGTLQVSTDDISSVYVRDAESIINGYLAGRYVLPLSPEPLLTDLASDIAIYRVLRDRAPRIPEFMQSRYTDAMALLMSIKSGDMQLTGSDVIVNPSGDQEAWSNVADPNGPLQNGPVFRPIESESCVSSADWLTF